MHIFINERDVGAMPTGGATIGEIFEAARVHVDPRNIVTAVELDGAVHQVGDDDRYLRRPADSVGTFVLHTQTPADFAAGKRQDLAAAAAVLAAKVRRVASLLREGDERGGNSLLAALMEELRLALLLEHNIATLDGRPAGEAQDAIRVIAPMLLEAQQQRAWTTVAEILEARLVGVLEGWSARLETGAASAF